MDPITIALLFAVVVLGTKTGRGAIRNGVSSGYKATGWRTPSQAIVHHSGRGGEWIGRWTAKGARAARKGIVSRIKDRWRRFRKTSDAPAELPPLDSVPTFPDSYRSFGDGAPSGLPDPAPNPSADPTAGVSAPPLSAVPATPTAPTRRPTLSKGSLTVSQLIINIEPPTTDAEFLDDCRSIAGVMRALAAEIGEWATGVAALGIPAEVTNPLAGIADGLAAAADGAMQAATRFEDSFEEAREVAARGMTITGQDAA